jgi:hypothetical protein
MMTDEARYLGLMRFVSALRLPVVLDKKKRFELRKLFGIEPHSYIIITLCIRSFCKVTSFKIKLSSYHKTKQVKLKQKLIWLGTFCVSTHIYTILNSKYLL